MLVPALLAFVAGGSLHADPNDTFYRIENRTSGSLILTLHTARSGGSILLAHGSVFIPFTLADRGWVIPAGCCPMLTFRHPGRISVDFALRPLASLMDMRSAMRFQLNSLSPRAGGGSGLDRTIVVSADGLTEVGTEEPSNSSAPVTEVSPQMSREAMVRALEQASSNASSYYSSIPDSYYLTPHVGLDEPTLRVLNVDKEMLIWLTFKAPVLKTKPLMVTICESHPDGGRYAYSQPTATRILEGNLNEYFFVAPPHRAGTVLFHVQDWQCNSVGQVAFTYPKDHQVSRIELVEPMGGGAEPWEETKEREVKRPWDAPLAASAGGEGKEEKDPAGPRTKRAREAAPAPPDADPVVEPEPASALLLKLPAILQRHVVSFDPNAFRELNSKFQVHARMTTARFTVPATMKSEDLIEFMAVNRGIRHITCLKSKVTSAGLEKALNANTALETIEILDDKVHTPDRIERILNAHPRLRVFALNDKFHVTAAFLDRWIDKTQLRELRICGNAVDRLDFSNFTSLEKLSIKNCALPDAFLPNCLTDLSIANCSEFTARGSAFRLHSFATDRLDLFDGFANQPLLESLTAGRPGAPSRVYGALEEQHLLGFIQGCSSLTRLTLSGSFSHSFQAGLPHRLTDLRMDGAMGISPTTHGGLEFRHLSKLVRLRIDYMNDKNDLNLPPALEELSLFGGRVRDTTVLPSTLKKVSLRHVVTNDKWLSVPITQLEIESCDFFTPTRMTNLLRRLNQLQTLAYSGWRNGAIDPAEFDSHPTLQEAYTKRLPSSDPWLLWQAGSSKKSSSSSSSSIQ
jgi:hypothetical protein